MDAYVEYVSFHNPLANKFLSDLKCVKDVRGSSWSTLTEEDQELWDSHYFGVSQDEGVPIEVFPKLKLHLEDKANVDIDSDGWTWQDEHSGPFSWMSKSQQDLSLDELSEIKGQNETTENDVNLLGKPGVRGSQLVTPIASQGLSEIEAAFQRFGLKSPNNDENIIQENEGPTLAIDESHEESITEMPDLPDFEPFSSSFMRGQSKLSTTDSSVLSMSLSSIGKDYSSSPLPQISAKDNSAASQSFTTSTLPEEDLHEKEVVPSTSIPSKKETSESAIRRTSVPKSTIRETYVPESTICETTVPESIIRETTIYESTMSESTVSESTIPERVQLSTGADEAEKTTDWDKSGKAVAKVECKIDDWAAPMTESTSSLVLPKTGLDFLDNW